MKSKLKKFTWPDLSIYWRFCIEDKRLDIVKMGRKCGLRWANHKCWNTQMNEVSSSKPLHHEKVTVSVFFQPDIWRTNKSNSPAPFWVRISLRDKFCLSMFSHDNKSVLISPVIVINDASIPTKKHQDWIKCTQIYIFPSRDLNLSSHSTLEIFTYLFI